jgi:hypothetical protein
MLVSMLGWSSPSFFLRVGLTDLGTLLGGLLGSLLNTSELGGLLGGTAPEATAT